MSTLRDDREEFSNSWLFYVALCGGIQVVNNGEQVVVRGGFGQFLGVMWPLCPVYSIFICCVVRIG